MKKRMNKILSVLLVSALVITAGNVALAEDSGTPESNVQTVDGTETSDIGNTTEKAAAAIPDLEESLMEPEIEKRMEEASDTTDVNEQIAELIKQNSIPVTTMLTVTGKENIKTGRVVYTEEQKVGNYYGFRRSFKASAKGTIFMAVAKTYGDKNVFYGVYKDANLTQPVDGYDTAGVNAVRYRTFKIPKAGTYYLGVYTSSSVTIQEAGVAALFFNGGNRTIYNGKNNLVGTKVQQTNYFKFKALSTGYITVKGLKHSFKDIGSSSAEPGAYKVTLCNSQKRALSGATALRYGPTYGVTRGKVYYIKIQTGSNLSRSGYYGFNVKNTKITEKSGSKKSKAVTIKKNIVKKGTIQAGSSQADWYKLNLTNKKFQATMTYRTNDRLKMTLYRNGKKMKSVTGDYMHGKVYIYGSNIATGTYYIKIERYNSKSSGYYSLKWNNTIRRY